MFYKPLIANQNVVYIDPRIQTGIIMANLCGNEVHFVVKENMPSNQMHVANKPTVKVSNVHDWLPNISTMKQSHARDKLPKAPENKISQLQNSLKAGRNATVNTSTTEMTI